MLPSTDINLLPQEPVTVYQKIFLHHHLSVHICKDFDYFQLQSLGKSQPTIDITLYCGELRLRQRINGAFLEIIRRCFYLFFCFCCKSFNSPMQKLNPTELQENTKRRKCTENWEGILLTYNILSFKSEMNSSFNVSTVEMLLRMMENQWWWWDWQPDVFLQQSLDAGGKHVSW